MKSLVLDTCALIDLFHGRREVLDALNKSERILVPAVVLGEFLSGLGTDKKSEALRRVLDDFLHMPNVFPHVVSDATAVRYADIRRQLKAAGTPLPINDLWIAACAQEADAPLLTFDQDFQRIPGLLLTVGINNPTI